MKIHNVTPNLNTYKNNQNVQNNKNISFSGIGSENKFIQGAQKFFNLSRGGTMTERLFVANAFIFLLGGRLISSRDKNERRETLTRDIPTIVTAVYGVPFVEKFAAKWIQDKSGFAIGEAASKLFSKSEKSKTKLDVDNFVKLDDCYRYDSRLDTGKGFDGFLNRFVDKGGSLKKTCSPLSGDIKAKLANFSDDNTKFLEELNKPEHKALKQSIKEAFSNPEGNKALSLARKFKIIPKIIGFVLTLSTIGLFIPKLNIHITERVNKKAKQRELRAQKAKEANVNKTA